MGFQRTMLDIINAVIAKGNKKAKTARYVGRVASASTAAGLAQVHASEQNAIVTEVLTIG